MVYQVSEQAVFNRFMAPVVEWRRQHNCEKSIGHQLKVEEKRIVCEECGAEWRMESAFLRAEEAFQ